MNVAVVGSGIMGNGIAQTAAMAGHDVWLNDADPAALSRGLQTISVSLGRFVRAKKFDRRSADAVRARIYDSDDLAAVVREADVVIEAVSERLDLKQEVFRQIIESTPGGALLATNTSQISITMIGSGLGSDAERLVGMHFFNPPVLMELCELVKGHLTSDETLGRAQRFAEGLGKHVVVCRKDSPGFITSRAAAALRLECLRMLEEGLATAEDIDTALRLGFNHPMGPLELGDFNGHDTYLLALESLCNAFGERFRPTIGLKTMVAAGRLGRKTGQGFYRYDASGRRLASEDEPA
jgi:3-hydroxybutyryl-CoA dehydrogenase